MGNVIYVSRGGMSHLPACNISHRRRITYELNSIPAGNLFILSFGWIANLSEFAGNQKNDIFNLEQKL